MLYLHGLYHYIFPDVHLTFTRPPNHHLVLVAKPLQTLSQGPLLTFCKLVQEFTRRGRESGPWACQLFGSVQKMLIDFPCHVVKWWCTVSGYNNTTTFKLWPDPSTRHQSPLRIPGVRRVFTLSHCHHEIQSHCHQHFRKGFYSLNLWPNDKMQMSYCIYKITITFMK